MPGRNYSELPWIYEASTVMFAKPAAVTENPVLIPEIMDI